MLFFFSSRRRHTRSLRDWSSDVCSSDLEGVFRHNKDGDPCATKFEEFAACQVEFMERSEERRVGKECRSGTSRYHEQKNVEANVYGTLDCVGYPSLPAPVEFLAAVSAYS